MAVRYLAIVVDNRTVTIPLDGAASLVLLRENDDGGDHHIERSYNVCVGFSGAVRLTSANRYQFEALHFDVPTKPRRPDPPRTIFRIHQ